VVKIDRLLFSAPSNFPRVVNKRARPRHEAEGLGRKESVAVGSHLSAFRDSFTSVLFLV
jgi:hypothetical protein